MTNLIKDVMGQKELDTTGNIILEYALFKISELVLILES